MPYLELPERHNLRLFHLINPSGRGEDDSTPLDPSRHTIVYLHAGTSSASGGLIEQQRDPRLRAGFNCLFLDSPHHGKTTQDDKKEHTIEDSADDLLAALRVLQVPSYTIFAEGVQGAGSAAWMALKDPDRVKGLLLASPAPLRESPEVHDSLFQLVEAMSTNKDGRGDGTGRIDDETIHHVADYFVGPLPRLQALRKSTEEAFQERYGTGKSAHDMRWIIISGAEREPPSPEALASIKCPVLLLSGTEDRLISPRSAAEEWQAALTGAKDGAVLHEIAGAPHMLSRSDYSVVNRLIYKFAQQTGPVPAA